MRGIGSRRSVSGAHPSSSASSRCLCPGGQVKVLHSWPGQIPPAATVELEQVAVVHEPIEERPPRRCCRKYRNPSSGSGCRCGCSSRYIASTWRFLRPWMRGAAQRSSQCASHAFCSSIDSKRRPRGAEGPRMFDRPWRMRGAFHDDQARGAAARENPGAPPARETPLTEVRQAPAFITRRPRDPSGRSLEGHNSSD
jgi:hypothetical protein